MLTGQPALFIFYSQEDRLEVFTSAILKRYCKIRNKGTENLNQKGRDSSSSSFPFPIVSLRRRGCLVAPLFL
jgi:hypothetical protein